MNRIQLQENSGVVPCIRRRYACMGLRHSVTFAIVDLRIEKLSPTVLKQLMALLLPVHIKQAERRAEFAKLSRMRAEDWIPWTGIGDLEQKASRNFQNEQNNQQNLNVLRALLKA